jgi:hypothetical protein
VRPGTNGPEGDAAPGGRRYEALPRGYVIRRRIGKRTLVVVMQEACVHGVSTCPVGGNQSTMRYTVEQGVPEGPPTYLDARQCGEDAAA